MSRTSSNRIVLEGTAEQRLPGLSLYLVCVNDVSNKDYLYEFSGDLKDGSSIDPRDYPDTKWDIFASYGRISTPPKERTRKLLFSNVTASEAIEKIHDDVLRSRKEYSVVHPPAWWIPIEKAEIEQVKVMLAQGVDLAIEHERLAAAYEDDDFTAEMKYDGHRSKAHFYGFDPSGAESPDARVRFDSRRQSDITGIYSENTEQLAHISLARPEAIRALHGTILDGEMMHEGGISAIGSVMGAHAEKALKWQAENGHVTFMVFDCVRVGTTWIHKEPWTVRRSYVEKIVAMWQDAIPEPDFRKFIKATSYWEGTQAKKDIRKWAFDNGYEGLILKKKSAPYAFGSRSWNWIKDKRKGRYSCIITGFENSKSEKYGPRGWIEHMKVGQYENGHLVEISQIGSMDEQTREWLSNNRHRALGMVVEIEAQEQIKGTHAFRHASFVAFRTDIKPEECVTGQKG